VHPVTGPAVSGSPDVFVNAKPSLRVGDVGVHGACCGANNWTATQGAPGVYINGRAVHRRGDATKHCGGIGKLVAGSPDVFVGDSGGGPAGAPTDPLYWSRFRVVDEHDGEPIPLLPYRIELTDGRVARGRTDSLGFTQWVFGESGVSATLIEEDEA
jgi:uncharacterized Zn-binding protein involved in type VI secretion